jgi:probable F420-dependent oxidoreductase
MAPGRNSHNPFRFCVAADGCGTGAEWRDLARRIEASGYELLAVTDHIDQAMAPFTALAAAAAVTTTLRLGSYVMCQDLRNPVVLSKEFATLDVLSDGRAEIGLGAGWRERDYQQAGIPFRSRPERFGRFEEYVELVRGLTGGSLVTYEGRYFSAAGVQCIPAPVQQPVPLLIGGSRRRSLELAARRADTVSIAPATGAGGNRISFRDFEVDTRVRWVRAAAAGRPGQPDIDLAIHECWVLPRPGELITRLCAARKISGDELDSIPSFLIGPAGHVAELLLARRERWGASRVTIPASAADAMAPVVARLSGT